MPTAELRGGRCHSRACRGEQQALCKCKGAHTPIPASSLPPSRSLPASLRSLKWNPTRCVLPAAHMPLPRCPSPHRPCRPTSVSLRPPWTACPGTSSPAPPPPAGQQATLSVQCHSCRARLTGLDLSVRCSNLAKNQSLTFDIVGEGNLPRVTVVRPILYNQHGNPLLLFKRLLLGHSETLPLVLKNSGTIPAKVLLEGEACGEKGESFRSKTSDFGVSAIPNS